MITSFLLRTGTGLLATLIAVADTLAQPTAGFASLNKQALILMASLPVAADVTS